MSGVRGHLEVLLPQPEIDYGYIGFGHMLPRSDGIFLGGTFDPDDWSLAVNPDRDHERVRLGVPALIYDRAYATILIPVSDVCNLDISA